MSIFAKKSLEDVLASAKHKEGEVSLKKSLSAWTLVALGVGAIIGAGLFIRTAQAAAEAAGPAVSISFVIAAIGCAFAGLCYAEFSSMIPVSGSAYTYAYTSMSEIVAWVVGWSLILEYGLGATTVAIAWSEYLNSFLASVFHFQIPYEFIHSPFETSINGTSGIINIPAIFVVLVLTIVLIKGITESVIVNTIIVFIKVAIVFLFIFIGWQFIDPNNYTPFLIPEQTEGYSGFFNHGIGGIFRGAAIVFFAFIGFDAVSTTAQETKNPKKDMPIGILGSLVVCTIIYVLFGHVLTGIANWKEFLTTGKEASVAYAILTHMQGYEWLASMITIAIIAGFTSVILVMLIGQSRVFYTMSKDGLLPTIFSHLHNKFHTPYKSNIILFLFIAVLAGFMPGSMAGDLSSVGTLLAFIVVCLGIPIMRRRRPDLARPFKVPLVPLVPILGVIVCSVLILSLNMYTKIACIIWIIFGIIIYFAYSRKNSNLSKQKINRV